jgi:hypothetical protein
MAMLVAVVVAAVVVVWRLALQPAQVGQASLVCVICLTAVGKAEVEPLSQAGRFLM